MMKKFVFRLDKVLGYRSYREREAQKDLLYAKNEQMRRKKEIECLAVKRKEIARECIDEGFQGIAVPRYQLYQNFLNKLDYELEETIHRLKEDDKRVKDQEVILKKKTINRKTLEILKDLKKQDYVEALEKEEQKALDEMVILRREQRV